MSRRPRLRWAGYAVALCLLGIALGIVLWAEGPSPLAEALGAAAVVVLLGAGWLDASSQKATDRSRLKPSPSPKPSPRPELPVQDELPIVALEIEDSIDLHTFAPRDVVSVVDSYLEAACEKGLREVRLIHGRGKGVQRTRVQSLLRKHPLVERFADAPPSRGGWGATIAWLRPTQKTPANRLPAEQAERRL